MGILKNVLLDIRRKKIAATVFLPLLVAAILLTAFLSLLIAHTASGDGWDLYNYVSGVTIKDDSNQAITDGIYYFGINYKMDITFSEFAGSGGQFEYNEEGEEGLLVYQLPGEIEVLSAVTNGEICVAGGKVIGWYNIDWTAGSRCGSAITTTAAMNWRI